MRMSDAVRQVGGPRCALALLAAMGLMFGDAAHASFGISWHSIASGGTTFSTGGSFRLGGTTGQPTAGSMAGGAFAVSGGFWGAGSGSTSVPSWDDAIAGNAALRGVNPSPFRTGTQVVLDLGREAPVELDVYDLTGRRVRSLISGTQTPGRYQVNWNGDDGSGRQLPSGVYLLRLKSGSKVETRRLVRVE
jgi:hypothetical protein